VRRHFLSVLERSTVGELGVDPGGTEHVAADFRHHAGRGGAAADHPPGVRLAHRLVGLTLAAIRPKVAIRRCLSGCARLAPGTKVHPGSGEDETAREPSMAPSHTNTSPSRTVNRK